ncbi:MAG TPA: PLDc N-terminal domain-containing protein [Segetibacter sp.]
MELVSPGMGLIFWTLFITVMFIIPLIALISLLRSTFKDSLTKLIWLLVILFVPLVGSILYFVIGRNQRINVASPHTALNTKLP